MSMSTSIVYGYGFPIKDVTVETINSFLETHTDLIPNYHTMEECEEELKKCLPKYYTCGVSGQEGVGAVISNIMTKETGIRFEYQPSMQEYSDDSPCIIFSECLPWLLSEKEKELTQDSLDDIMMPYIKELGLSPDICDRQQIEYWG